MNKTRIRTLFITWLVLGIATIMFSVPSFAAKKDRGPGEVVMVFKASHFSMTGGDPVTLVGAGQAVLPDPLFEGMAWTDPNKNALPGLAKSWKVAANWKYIDFELRKGVKFHNGDEVTAEDFKYSWEAYMGRHGRSKFATRGILKRQIKQIEVQGPYKLRLHLNSPWPWWDVQLPWVMPKAYREKVGAKGFADKPVGSGPFKWVDYKADTWVRLAAVKNHYRKTPGIKTIKLMAVPEHSTRLAMLKTGEADIVGLIGPHIRQVRKNPKLRIKMLKDIQEQVLLYTDLAHPDKASPWHDKRVRIAASMAIDRKTITEKILFGLGTPTGEVIAPITKGFDPGVKTDPYNPEEAKRLLAEAGYPNGFKTVVTTKATRKLFMQAIASNLSDVGIQVDFKVMENAAWNKALRNKKHQGLTHLASYFGGHTHVAKDGLTLFTTLTPWCYSTTPEIQKAIMKSMYAISDEDKFKAGRQISKMIRDSRIRLPLWRNHTAMGMGPRIKSYVPIAGVPTPRNFESITLND
jgi:peptide/nickel transport system substrate-binding protein